MVMGRWKKTFLQGGILPESNFLTVRICCGMSSMTEGSLMLGFVYLVVPVFQIPLANHWTLVRNTCIFEALENKKRGGEIVHEHITSCQTKLFIQKYLTYLSRQALECQECRTHVPFIVLLHSMLHRQRVIFKVLWFQFDSVSRKH